MTLDDLLASQPKTRRKPRDEEHRLQVQCVKWFRYAHPDLAPLLFAIPNGGARNEITGAKLKAEGVVAGVADLCLAVPRCGGVLFIEMKTPTGRQSQSQLQWQAAVSIVGNTYVIIRTLEDFISTINYYLNNYGTDR